MNKIILFFLFTAILYGINNSNNTDDAVSSINEESIKKNVLILASDDFEGRQPSTPGEEKTINFLKDEFQKLGLKPGNNGSYFQKVPLAEIVSNSPELISVKGKSSETSLTFGSDFLIASSHLRKEINIEDAELVFVGYGIVAPEYDWNDYENVSIKNKIAIVLEDDPGRISGDSSFFSGAEMTYYGRWTYKYEEAARQGAAGVLIIHDPASSAYSWEALKGMWTSPRFYLAAQDSNLLNCKLEGWFTNKSADKIFSQAGLSLKQAVISSAKKDFKALPLGVTLSINMKNSFKESVSNNVLALLEGSERSDEYIIYTAHWDHFGVNPSAGEGDKIFNGAVDNATGTAALIEIAKAFTKLQEKPKRSVLFLAVTAEEQGLLGSEFYARYPVYPLSKTAAVINIDILNIIGRVKDIRIVGYGKSELDDYLKASAEEFNRVVKPDPWPQRGSFYRSDHFSFAKRGVPSLFTQVGLDNIEKGEQWMTERVFWWIQNHYHKASDQYDPSWWDFSGMADDIKVLFKTGFKLSMEDKFPNWLNGNEFKSIRDRMMSN